jgi:hypothetical protein
MRVIVGLRALACEVVQIGAEDPPGRLEAIEAGCDVIEPVSSFESPPRGFNTGQESPGQIRQLPPLRNHRSGTRLMNFP